LIDHNNLIPSKNLDAINSIHEKQINFAICTAKPYSVTKDICEKCNASYGIFGNGTQILNLKTGEELYKSILPIDTFNTCYGIAKQFNLHVHVYTDSEIITEKLMFMDLRNYKLNSNSNNLTFKIVDDIHSFVNLHSPQIFKLVFSSEDTLDDVKNIILNQLDLSIQHIKKKGQYKDTIIDKEYEYLDITQKNIGKGFALNLLCNFLNVDSNDIMAIGDNVNDIDMLQASGIGVTLADSYDEIKKIATYTTTNSVANSGFAEAVYKFVV